MITFTVNNQNQQAFQQHQQLHPDSMFKIFLNRMLGPVPPHALTHEVETWVCPACAEKATRVACKADNGHCTACDDKPELVGRVPFRLNQRY